MKFPPFQVTGDHCIAGALYEEAKKIHETRQALYYRLSQIDTGVANLKEATVVRKQLAELATHSALVRGGGGVDSFIAQVNWREFTDKEIVASFGQWVRDNRPTAPETKQLVGRHSDKGHKRSVRRVMLDRLCIMRLLHRRTLNEMYPEAFSRYRGTDWYRARMDANRDFHRLYPFLPGAEYPLSWPTKGRKK